MFGIHISNFKKIFGGQGVSGEVWRPNPARDWLRIIYVMFLAILVILAINYMLLTSLDNDSDIGGIDDTTLKTTNLEKAITSFTKRQALLERYMIVPPEIVDPL